MTISSSLQTISRAMQSGDFPLVEQLSRTALAENPARGDIYFFLAVSLQYQNRMPEAIDAYARLTELFPAQAVHWGNYGTALREAGRLDEAEKAYDEAIRLDGGSAAPHINAGLLLIQRHDYLAAREKMLDAVEREPDSPRARIHAAIACSFCQDFDRAERLVKPWRQWLPLDDDALQIELSNQLLLLGNGQAAQVVAENILERAPRNPQARIHLAMIYERINRLDDAEAILRGVEADGMRADPAMLRSIDHTLASIAVRRRDPAMAKTLLLHSGPSGDEDVPYWFSLAEVHDKLGEYAAAMQTLDKGHALKIDAIRQIAPEQFEPGAPALPTPVPEMSAEEYRSWPKFAAPDARNSPVFIVGFPRSGTTLLEQMLDAHPALQSMDENPFFNRLADTLKRHDSRILASLDVLRQYDVDELRKQYLLMVSERIGRRWDAQLVDKNPLNMLWLPFMHRLYPNAKYILALRHPCDVILSCYMQNFRSAILITASASIERLAAAYVAAMDSWLRNVEVLQPNVLISRYEDIVADLPQQARRLSSFLELDDASPMLKFDQHARDKGYIGTPSYSQVIEPVNTKGLNRWVRYRAYFEPALPVLKPMLERWGYSVDS
jgi:Flp pilus assembly protein TadD